MVITTKTPLKSLLTSHLRSSPPLLPFSPAAQASFHCRPTSTRIRMRCRLLTGRRGAKAPIASHTLSVSGDGKGKRSPWAVIWLRPTPTLMALDDRPTDGEPDSHPAAFGRVERLEQPPHRLRIEPHPRILSGQPHPITFV